MGAASTLDRHPGELVPWSTLEPPFQLGRDARSVLGERQLR
jgi:hypothetical protein